MVYGIAQPEIHFTGTYVRRKGTDGLVEFVGTVSKVEGKTMTVLNVGIEDTPEAIYKWLKDTIAMKRDLNREDVQAPDKYDRMGVTTNHIQVRH